MASAARSNPVLCKHKPDVVMHQDLGCSGSSKCLIPLYMTQIQSSLIALPTAQISLERVVYCLERLHPCIQHIELSKVTVKNLRRGGRQCGAGCDG